MKYKILTACLIMLVAVPALALRSDRSSTRPGTAATIDFGTWIDANKILMFETNKGSFAYDNGLHFGKADGLYFPFTSIEDIESGANTLSVIYAGTIWMGATDSVTGDTLLTSGQHDTDWGIGPLIGGQPVANAAGLPEYRVYVLYKDSLADNPNQDYLEWPVQDGAPVRPDTAWLDDGVTVDSIAIVPDMLGDQMLWSVTNDNDPLFHIHDAGTFGQGLGIEMRKTTFAWNRVGPLANIVFMKMQFYNEGGMTLENMYISVWADPDLGDASDDYVGCDTTLDLGYVYNAGATDPQYGSKPPAGGYDFFQGPLEYTGEDTDTALMWGTTWPGYVNMGLSSFNKYVNPYGPDVAEESYRFMTGLTKDGSPLIDHNGDTTKFFGYGDPVAGTGFLDDSPADRRYMQSVGPMTFRPGDSTEIIVAIVMAQGDDYLNSITQMKGIDAFAQSVYEDNFVVPDPPAAPVVNVAELDGDVVLSWGTDSEDNPGGYPFEGYAVFQGESSFGVWTWDTLAWFDLDNGIQGVADYVADPNLFPSARPVVIKPGTDSGLEYVYYISRDRITGKPLSNYTNYFFKVEAYSVDTTKPVLVKTLTSATELTIMPHGPITGTTLPYDGGEDLVVNHSAGGSDGTVTPTVTDPYALTGHDYSVTFGEFEDTVESAHEWFTFNTLTDTCSMDLVGGVWVATLCVDTTLDSTTMDTSVHMVTYWDLNDLDLGSTILSRQVNQTGDGEYVVVDGFQVVVAGPPLEGKDWEYISADPLNVSPVAAADNGYAGGNRWFSGDQANGGELLFGSVFMEPNWWGLTSVSPGDMKTVEIRYRPMESYTDLDLDGEYTPGEPYVVDDPSQTQNAFMYSFWGDPSEYLGFFPVPFTVWDVTDPDNPRQLNVAYRDRDGDNAWNLNSNTSPNPNLPNGGDNRFPYTWILNTDYDVSGTMYGDGTGGSTWFFGYEGGDGVWDAMWALWQYERGTSRGQLAEECTLRLIPNIINTPTDVFVFSATAPDVQASGAEELLNNIRPVPNPYYLFSAYDPSTYNRELRFTNLPEECTISIYNLGGDLVRTLEKDDDLTYTTWDLLNTVNVPLASGIYIYVVEAPGFGQKIGKMAIFTETEVLDQF